jgi:hypothetical protein
MVLFGCAYIGWGFEAVTARYTRRLERADETVRGKRLLVVKGVWRLKRNP